jgi:putative integral membrane protein (TIGR02587 family)
MKKEIHDLAKGSAGAFIFGMPLLYTMEVWFAGKTFSGMFHLVFLLTMIPANMLLVFIAGYRSKWSKTFFDTFMESISSCGMGIALSAAILWLIGAVNHLDQSHIGIILMEGLIMSLGISFANFKFNSGQDDSTGFSLPAGLLKRISPKKTLTQELIASVAGSLIFSLNIAPTEEVMLIATRIDPLQLLLLFLAEFFISYLIIAVVGKKSDHILRDKFQRPSIHALHTITVSLVISFFLILTFGYSNPEIDNSVFLSMVIVLSLPGVVGASAGRLIL